MIVIIIIIIIIIINKEKLRANIYNRNGKKSWE